MQELPVGVSSFVQIRRDHMLYVDKTAQLTKLIRNGRRYFLARPRRFGKTLMISTLKALFGGKEEFFTGLCGHTLALEFAKKRYPIVAIDLTNIDVHSAEDLKIAILQKIDDLADDFNVNVRGILLGDRFTNLLKKIYQKYGEIIILVDEYDKPILDNIDNIKLAEKIREILRSFYVVFKSCDEYIRFLLLTGISKFSKTGVFSALNNLKDISMLEEYGDIVGYTQKELEDNFEIWIEYAATKMKKNKAEFLAELKSQYDGYCFDGKTKIYSPFSILQCFQDGEFNNYWYSSGSSTFIVNYMKKHAIDNPGEYESIKVPSIFLDAHEIETAPVASFLYQGGYLTLEKKDKESFILTFPNQEVRESINKMYLYSIYNIKNYETIGERIWFALKDFDLTKVLAFYNQALNSIPYDDFPHNKNEYWYRSLFMMLLKGTGILALGEVHGSSGRSDVVILFQEGIIVIEFKCAENEGHVNGARKEGEEQINSRNYLTEFQNARYRLIQAVFVVDLQKKICVL